LDCPREPRRAPASAKTRGFSLSLRQGFVRRRTGATPQANDSASEMNLLGVPLLPSDDDAPGLPLGPRVPSGSAFRRTPLPHSHRSRVVGDGGGDGFVFALRAGSRPVRGRTKTSLLPPPPPSTLSLTTYIKKAAYKPKGLPEGRSRCRRGNRAASGSRSLGHAARRDITALMAATTPSGRSTSFRLYEG
jgi:hypothetical protein